MIWNNSTVIHTVFSFEYCFFFLSGSSTLPSLYSYLTVTITVNLFFLTAAAALNAGALLWSLTPGHRRNFILYQSNHASQSKYFLQNKYYIYLSMLIPTSKQMHF